MDLDPTRIKDRLDARPTFRATAQDLSQRGAPAPEQGYHRGAEFLIPCNLEGYRCLSDVLARAFDQAAEGKGAQRHANGNAFDEQPMATINTMLGSVDGFLYQAIKKAVESKRLPKDRAVAELLGAINYLAGAVIALEK